MEHKIMNGHGGIFGTAITVVLYFIARLTLNDWAAVATIIAALITGGYTIYKWRYFYKKNKRDEKIP